MASIDKKYLKEQAKIKAQKIIHKVKASKRKEKAIEMPEPTGDPEVDSRNDLNAVSEEFRNAIKRENNRFELATDSEYWFAVCFQTREQKEFFLRAMELFEHGDKYLDGQVVAKKLGIKLPEAKVPYRTEGKIDKSYLEFVED
ncbi:TPA: hypothetical protein R4323_001110 [Pasteurella multocida]|nr:hypothetical protein [Pasteurella multocida]